MASSEKEATMGRMLMASPSLLKLAPRLQAGVRNSHSRRSAAKTEASKVGITPISQNKHRGCNRVGYDFAEGELDPKVCFIEIGAVGSSVDQATADRVQAAAVQATHDTGKPKAKTPPLVKRSFFASYIDDIAGYTIQKPRHAPQAYWVASNHLFSPAAVTNSTAQVVSRYTYDTFGKQTIRNGAGTIVADDASLMGRGFTGYSQCSEIGSYYARARMYSPRLGRFVNRDHLSYIDGYSLYRAYFTPNKLDFSGNGETAEKSCADCCRLYIAFQYTPDPGGEGGLIANNKQLLEDRDKQFDADPIEATRKFKGDLSSVGWRYSRLKKMIDDTTSKCPSKKIAVVVIGHGALGSGLEFPMSPEDVPADIRNGMFDPVANRQKVNMGDFSGGGNHLLDIFKTALGKSTKALVIKACNTAGPKLKEDELDPQGMANWLGYPVTGYNGQTGNNNLPENPETAFPQSPKSSSK